MSTIKRNLKKKQCIEHRKERHLHAIQKVIDGKAEPAYATKRWNKLREAEGK